MCSSKSKYKDSRSAAHLEENCTESLVLKNRVWKCCDRISGRVESTEFLCRVKKRIANNNGERKSVVKSCLIKWRVDCVREIVCKKTKKGRKLDKMNGKQRVGMK